MHDRAEFGIAAHWRYKEGASSSELAWMADLRRLHDDYDEPTEFLDNLKLDLYEDLVFVLTPRGDVRTLPRVPRRLTSPTRSIPKSAIDAREPKVNGRLVTLSTELVSGDIVEIITTKSDDSGPTRDWLSFVRSSRARSKIKRWFTRAHRETSLQIGKEKVADLMRREQRAPAQGEPRGDPG